MTRYCVQIIRTYEILAKDEAEAEDGALQWDAGPDLRAPPICNVTDLDEAARVRSGPNSI